MLQEFGLAYDLLLFPKHLIPSIELVRRFPGQTFILDHIAKPDIKNHRMEPWRTYIHQLADLENVYCKLSGMVTEASWNEWTPEEFTPYLDTVFDAFGPNRVMIGSDWPVCTLSGGYQETIEVVSRYIAQLEPSAREAILGENCARAYNL
jgi:L-fuconolactonase